MSRLSKIVLQARSPQVVRRLARAAAPIAPVVESVVAPPKPKERVLTEGADDNSFMLESCSPDARQLVECCEVGYPGGWYGEKTFDEKLRQACGILRDAIRSEAAKNLGDDGKVLKKVAWSSSELSYWEAIDNLLTREIFPDKFKSLVDTAKVELAKYIE